MRVLDVSQITNTAQMPLKQGTLQFLQDSYNESLVSLAAATLLGSNGTLQLNSAYVVYGCFKVIYAGTQYFLGAGAIMYNNEIYTFDGTILNLPAGVVPVASIAVTQYTTTADPVTFTDGSTHNVHNIRKIVFTAGASGSGLFDFDSMVRNLNSVPTVTQDNVQWAGTKTINFQRKQNIFLATTSAAGTNTLGFDFSYAVPGAEVWMFGTAPSGSKITWATGGLCETNNGSITINANQLFYITAIYRGKNGTLDEVSLIIRNP